jgi:hypothetical protein
MLSVRLSSSGTLAVADVFPESNVRRIWQGNGRGRITNSSGFTRALPNIA